MNTHIRPLAPRDPGESHRQATTLELFFDLVSVIAIAAITAELHHAVSAGHGAEMLPNFAFLFLAIRWAWMNFTWFASAFDNDDPLYRVLVFTIITGELIFAGGAEQIYETLNFGWGLLGWIVMRVAMIGLWLRAAAGSEAYRGTALRYALGIGCAQVLWVLLYFGPEPGSAAFFLAGVAIFAVEFAVPLFAGRAKGTPWHREHIMERYGLLTIIVLGEGLLSVALGFGLLFGEHPEPAHWVTAISGAVMIYALWWLYFAKAEHMTSTASWRGFLWGYGHVFFFAACAVLGAGIAAELDIAAHHSEVGQDVVAWYLGLPWTMALLSLWMIRDRFLPLGARGLAMPAMAAASLGAAALGLPAAGFAALAVATLLWRVPMLKPEADAS